MTDKPKRKSRRRIPKPKDSRYYVKITSWQASCGIYTHTQRKTGASCYLEGFGVEVTGVMLYPEKLRGQPIELAIAGDRAILPTGDDRKDYAFDVLPVGYLNNRKSLNSAWCRLPQDMIPTVIQLLAIGHLQYCALYGDVLNRGSAQMNSLNLFHQLNGGNCPEIEEFPEVPIIPGPNAEME